MHKTKWIICGDCAGDGTVENPAFSNGFTSSEWQDAGEEFQQTYMTGGYNVPCGRCAGSGKVCVPNVAALNFGEKRQLVLAQREAEFNDQEARHDLATMRAESGYRD